MKEITQTVYLKVFEDTNELSKEANNLMQQAIKIRKKAYAPYSKFRVGTAILLDNGQIVLGSNQENAAYPSGLCAERVAIFSAGTNYPDAKILKIAISATSDNKTNRTPIPPCGACRQSIAEYEIKQEAAIEIFFMGAEGEVYMTDSLKNILPFMFDKNSL